MVSSAVEKRKSEKRDGDSWSGWEVGSSSLWRVTVEQRGAGGACGCQRERHREEGSVRERPGMFWNSEASLAGVERVRGCMGEVSAGFRSC